MFCFKKCMKLFIQFLLIEYLQSMCPTKMSSESGDYDVLNRFNKIKKEHNMLTVTHTHNRGKKETYKYTIKFCGKYNQSAVQQIDETNGKIITVGKLNKNTTLIGGENWIFLQWFHGDVYKSHCHKQNRKAWLYIRCEDQGEKPQLRVIEENRYLHKKIRTFRHCFYLFEYNTPLACNIDKKLSGGSIFIIVLISLFAAYFLFGFLYQRFVAHAKGFDQIPNYPFWRKIGNMSADGCDFVCRREERSNTYKGMADALDINSSDDEDKDDGLLPM